MRTSILALLALTACEEVQPFLPTVQFNRLEVEDVDFEGARVAFHFDVENPNPVDIKLSSFSYQLGLMGTEFLAGDNQDGFALEAVGGSELDLPVDLLWEQAWDTVQATRGEDFIDFSLGGNFGFDSPIGEILLPYQNQGDFPAVRTPKFSLKNLKVRQLDLWSGTAKVDVMVGVDNAHGSTLMFNNFDYTVGLGGHDVASGLIPQFAQVEGATEQIVGLPVAVDLVSAGTSVYNAITGNGRLNVDLLATTDVDTPFGVLPLSVDENGDLQVEQAD
ncbi:MAG: LEA type 2 family protein [Deltaproteobacteria bacterium]|nr:LEA type 2 family protein [Deltaproteobacteria bacterium]